MAGESDLTFIGSEEDRLSKGLVSNIQGEVENTNEIIGRIFKLIGERTIEGLAALGILCSDHLGLTQLNSLNTGSGSDLSEVDIGSAFNDGLCGIVFIKGFDVDGLNNDNDVVFLIDSNTREFSGLRSAGIFSLFFCSENRHRKSREHHDDKEQ